MTDPLLPDLGIIALVPDRWGGVWMSRHHILTRLARYAHVVWVDAPHEWRQYWLPGRPRRVSPSLAQPAVPQPFQVLRPGRWLPRIYRPHTAGMLIERYRLRMARRALWRRGARRTVLSFWRPDFLPALDLVPHDLSCYHVADEYTFAETEQPIPAAERALLERVQQVFVHSPALLDKKGGINPNTALVPNGVDYSAFASPTPEPDDLRAIPRPRIGYVGYVKRELDLALLLELASRRPAWSVVLVGPVRVEGEAQRLLETLRARPNVHVLGARSPAQVPAYPRHMDACVLPYRVNDYTKYIYPLKLQEYLATGRPVVATPIRSVVEFAPPIRLARTVEEWLDALEWAVGPAGMVADAVAARQAIARAHDWDLLVARIAGLLCTRLGPEYTARLDAGSPRAFRKGVPPVPSGSPRVGGPG